MAGWESHRRTRERGVPAVQRRRILRRDRGVCQIGGPDCRVAASEVDHVVPAFEGGADGDENLRAVCRTCHASKSREEAARARALLSRKRKPRPRVGSFEGSSR